MINDEPGKLIVFESIDGAGKTSQSKALAEIINAYWTKEPSTNPIGQVTRQLLKDSTVPVDRTSMCLLYVADSIQHTAEEILPKLKRGEHVVCDRYIWSTLAYQGIYFGQDWLLELMKYNYINLPSLTILLDCEVNVAENRRNSRTDTPERYDDMEIQKRARENYLKLARQHPDHCAIVNANRDFKEIQDEIYQIVMRKLFQNEFQSGRLGNRGG